MTTDTTTRVEYAIRFGDGDIDYETEERHELADLISGWRQDIALNPALAEDYEPMGILKRTVTTTVTPWEDDA